MVEMRRVPTSLRIFVHLRQFNSGLTAAEIGADLDLKDNTVYRNLNLLHELKLVRVRGFIHPKKGGGPRATVWGVEPWR